MQHKIFINGKRHKVILAGNNYKINIPVFDWASYGNLAGKTLSFKYKDTETLFGFSELYTRLLNSGLPGQAQPVITITTNAGYKIIITGGYTQETQVEVRKPDGKNTYDYVWNSSGSFININQKVTLPADVDLRVVNISFTQEGSSQDVYLSNKEFILNWLNEHLIVE
jgi:hypothetical protein